MNRITDEQGNTETDSKEMQSLVREYLKIYTQVRKSKING